MTGQGRERNGGLLGMISKPRLAAGLALAIAYGSGAGMAWAAHKKPDANRLVDYGKAPDWVRPPAAEAAPPAATPDASPTRMIYNDLEQRVSKGATTTYSAFRVAILRPEALQLGNLNLVWNPDTTHVTVNSLLVHRDGQVIDVLKTAKFQIFQREGGLEQAMLNGELTANLQIPGLRVGDEIEFTQTQVSRNSVFGNHHFNVLMLSPNLAPGTYRMALAWDADAVPQVKASDDLAADVVRADRGIHVTLRNPDKFVAPDEAPARYSVARYIQYSDYSGWQDVSRDWSGLFSAASQIPAGSALQTEIARIRASSIDPRAQALAALALVQDKVRYVYVGMDGGNFTPAPADETWERRFGDCKGKTALLLGILQALGISAQPVLVNLAGDDGMNAFLPSPAMFNHVVLTTNFAGQRQWLDGTRQGEHRLLSDADVPYRWALPVSAEGQPLEALPYRAPAVPREITFTDIDARAGVDTDAKITLTRILRGDDALGINIALSSQSHDVSEEALRKSIAGGWITPDKIDWHYDTNQGTMTIITSGTTKLDWEKGQRSFTYYLPGGGFYPPSERKRPEGQDQKAPYANTPGTFSCSVTRVKLPVLPGSVWGITSRSMNQTIGGIAYYRQSQIDHGTASLIRSSRTVEAEISPEQARQANARIEGFDNNKSYVVSYPGKGDSTELNGAPMANFDTVDWSADPSPCLPANAASGAEKRDTQKP